MRPDPTPKSAPKSTPESAPESTPESAGALESAGADEMPAHRRADTHEPVTITAGASVHPADDMVRSAHAVLPAADEYLIDSTAPVGALVKADATKLLIDAQKDGKLRLTCGSWEDARVLLPGQMLGLRREGTFWVISRIEAKK